MSRDDSTPDGNILYDLIPGYEESTDQADQVVARVVHHDPPQEEHFPEGIHRPQRRDDRVVRRPRERHRTHYHHRAPTDRGSRHQRRRRRAPPAYDPDDGQNGPSQFQNFPESRSEPGDFREDADWTGDIGAAPPQAPPPPPPPRRMMPRAVPQQELLVAMGQQLEWEGNIASLERLCQSARGPRRARMEASLHVAGRMAELNYQHFLDAFTGS